MRLIDGDALRDLMQSLAYDDWNQGVNTSWADAFRECARRVEEAPTVDAVPVVHGHWITAGAPDIDGNQSYRCSVCDCLELHSPSAKVSYCWNCGASLS